MNNSYFCLDCEDVFDSTAIDKCCLYCGSNLVEPITDSELSDLWDEGHFEGDFTHDPVSSEIED